MILVLMVAVIIDLWDHEKYIKNRNSDARKYEEIVKKDEKKKKTPETKDDEETEMQDNIIEMATNKGNEMSRDKNVIWL